MPQEIKEELFLVLHKYGWAVMIVFLSVIIMYFSVLILGQNNAVEIESEKIIDIQTGLNLYSKP